MAKTGKSEQLAARRARLSAALRENLKRRKAQARDRAELDGELPEGAGAEDNNEKSPNPRIDSPGPDFRRNRSRD